VYGPWGRPDMAYFRIIDSILNDKEFELYGDGSTKRDFTFIDDTVQCVVKLINDLDNKEKSFNDLVNIGGGSPKSMSDLVHEIELISGKKLKVSQKERFNGDATLTVSDDSYLKELIEFSPRIAIADGMREVFQWAENPNVRSELSNWVESTK
jgi:UDP-glucuronate 4-epimerase